MQANSALNPPKKIDNKYCLGASRNYFWKVDKKTVDMTLTREISRKIKIYAEPQDIILDLNKTALIIIDMQNDFCTKGGWVDSIGGDYTPNRKPISAISRLNSALRELQIPIIWLNWGNRPDLLNMAQNQLHLYSPDGETLGLGDALPSNGARVLEKDSWASHVVDELVIETQDISVDKYRISGFWDTPLDSILRNLNLRTLLFAGVNIDQCVMCTLQDANFLGYGCVLLEDCCATTSPEYCTQATLWNIKNCFGFVSNSMNLLTSINDKKLPD
jgi:nicotinamidase-related amidase